MIRVRKLRESSFSWGCYTERRELDQFDSLSFLTLIHGSLINLLKNREPDSELLVLFPVNCVITFLFLVKRDFGDRREP